MMVVYTLKNEMKNLHVKKYLKYYTKLKKSPEYAVLLRGKWGCGKSWFIRDFMGENIGKKYIYVSLYGIAKFSEIEEIIFQQINPILGSKKMKLAGTILKGTIKAAIRIDLDGDKKDDLTISPNLSNIKVPGYLKNLDKKILIFDDLERCGIPLNNILGYINQLVENKGQKVIIVANEDEIIDRFDEENEVAKNEYLRTKEKLIGRSFDIQADPENAYDAFVSFLSDKKTRELLTDKKKLVLDIYTSSEYHNLRHIRQSIQDFGLFYEFLPTKTFEKEELVEHIMKLFFLISFEVKSGAVKEDEISELFLRELFITTKDGEQTLMSKIRSKYSILDHAIIPLASHNNNWHSFFKHGFIDKKNIEESISGSYYFINERTPSWEKLWHFWNLEDDELDPLITNVYEKYRTFKYKNQYIIIHVVGILLNLVRFNLLPYTKESIIEMGKANIELLRKENLLKTDLSEGIDGETKFGKRYRNLDDELFVGFINWIKTESKKATEENLPQKAIELKNKLKESVVEFGNEITMRNILSPYFNVPILNLIPAKEFIEIVLKLPNRELRELDRIIKKRYEIRNYQISLREESGWLEEVRKGLEIEVDKLPTKLSTILIQDMLLKQIGVAISNIRGRDAIDI